MSPNRRNHFPGSGKADRHRKDNPRKNAGKEEFDETEKKVAKIWQEVLGEEEMPGLHEEFFDFGGDSMDIVRVRIKLAEISGKEIEMSDIFDDPTVCGMASLIK